MDQMWEWTEREWMWRIRSEDGSRGQHGSDGHKGVSCVISVKDNTLI